MDPKIYILRNRKLIRGPYTLEKIKSKLLSKDDLIWYQGLPDWTKAHLVDQVRELINEHTFEPAQSPFQKLRNFFW